VDARHHFRLLKLPFNLLEPGAVLQNIQLGGGSALDFAQKKG
jgi:hypothetical protein